MKLFAQIKNFRNDEDGAVTVDWVVLTAAIVGLGLAIMVSVGNSTKHSQTKSQASWLHKQPASQAWVRKNRLIKV